jgi:hypothetical protein
VASSRDRHGGKAQRQRREDQKGTKRPSERAKRELRKLDQRGAVSSEMAAELQTQWGNQAVAQLLDLDALGLQSGHAGERSELADEERALLELLDQDQGTPQLLSEQGSALLQGVGKGLPSVAEAGPATERQYGGDDDDDDPIPMPDDIPGTALRFARPGRGNLAKLRELRSAGELATATLARVGEDVAGALPAATTAPPRPVGDALFVSPMEAWGDASTVAGRGCGVDDLQRLAGPYDALGRPMAVGTFAADRATTPAGRSLARLCSAAPGTLMPAGSGLAGAAARIGALASLALAAEGLHRGGLRDRAAHIANNQAALELVLRVAGDVAESVPPAHRLYARVTGQGVRGPPPTAEPSPEARHWILPALCAVGQVLPLPDVLRWSPPPPAPVLDPDDPMSVVDTALLGGASGGVAAADLSPLLRSIEALLAAGGRAQVELCAAALACRRPAFDGMIDACLRRAYRAFRAAALELLAAQRVLGEAHQQVVAPFPPQLLQANDELERLRDRMVRAREACLLGLTATCELG